MASAKLAVPGYETHTAVRTPCCAMRDRIQRNRSTKPAPGPQAGLGNASTATPRAAARARKSGWQPPMD